MILWCVVAGALIGWLVNDFGGGIVSGALLGGGMGWWLRRILRGEIAAAQEPLWAELLAWREGAATAGMTSAAAQAVAHAAAAPDANGAVPVGALAPDGEPTETIAEDTPEQPFASGPWDRTHPRPAEELVPVNAPRPAESGFDPEPLASREPPAPSLPERLFAAATGWLFGGNTIVRVGLVILFVGLSFLARYAAAAGLFPIEFRLALVAAAGVALLAVGFAKRAIRPDFALSLQGGGVAILYLTLFGASRLFELIPISAAFPLMILVCALGCALALLQNSQALAATSFAGGFAVPLLLAGEGSALGLFGYYAVLNLAVLAIAWRRAWRSVNLIGFVATFGVATAWGVLVYDPALYAVSQTFLVLFVLIYVAAGILHTQARPGVRGNIVDGTLLFGPALIGFGLQVGLVRHLAYGSAFSALGFGALYLALAWFVVRRGRGDNRVLFDGLIAVSVGFVTLAVPLALSVRWTASVWALEGAGAYWVGTRQARWLPRAFGLALQVAAAVSFLAAVGVNVAAAPLANPNTLGALLLALAALAIAWWLRVPAPHEGTRRAESFAEIERSLPAAMFLYGFFLVQVACLLEINRLVPPRETGGPLLFALDANGRLLGAMLAYVVTAAIAAWAGRRLGWAVALWPGRATLLALTAALIGRAGPGGFILVTPNWIVWGIALALHYRLLWEDDRTGEPATEPLRRLAHIGGVWLLAAIVTDCLWLGIDRGGLWNSSWAGVTFLAGAIASLLALTLLPGRIRRWPIAGRTHDYGWFAAAPIAALVFTGAAAAALLAAGETAPLPYVPLLNPVDLTVALAIAALALWRQRVVAMTPPPPGVEALRGPAPWIALAALGFLAINTVWLRIAHHYLDLAWEASALLGSFTVQAGLSILWTSLALGLTVTAHRRGLRTLWLVGAGLLGIVVAKLLLVDLSNADGAARIITFIVVGVLMLVVGYFAPLPPRSTENLEKQA